MFLKSCAFSSLHLSQKAHGKSSAQSHYEPTSGKMGESLSFVAFELCKKIQVISPLFLAL